MADNTRGNFFNSDPYENGGYFHNDDELRLDNDDAILFDTNDELPFDTNDELPFDTNDELQFDTNDELPFDTNDELPFHISDEMQRVIDNNEVHIYNEDVVHINNADREDAEEPEDDMESDDGDDEDNEELEEPESDSEGQGDQHFPDEMVPLWVASWNGDADIVRALLQAGVVNIEHGNQGTTPLMEAVAQGYADVVDMLLHAGANSMFVSAIRKNTCLTSAVYNVNTEVVQRDRMYGRVLQLLLEHDHTFVNVCRHDGASPLALAAANNEIDMAVMLIKYGADVNQLSPVHGETAIFDAVREARPDMVKLLIAENANVAIKSLRGSVVLHMAVFREDTQLVQMLMDAGADLEAADRKGVTPLHIVGRFGNNVMAEFLVRQPICMDPIDRYKMTPCDLADRCGHPDTAAIFRTEIERRAKCAAFAMGQLERLGDHSRVRWLDPGVVRMILEDV